MLTRPPAEAGVAALAIRRAMRPIGRKAGYTSKLFDKLARESRIAGHRLELRGRTFGHQTDFAISRPIVVVACTTTGCSAPVLRVGTLMVGSFRIVGLS